MSLDLLTELMQRLGYTFADKALLQMALRHRSMGKDNNERLEFLGDSVVNCVIAKAVFEKFPEACEGGLSRVRAELVNRDFLAEVAQELQLSDALMLGSGELKSGGYRRSSILADTLEAIIGAILLDSDFTTAEKTVMAWFNPALAQLHPDSLEKDGKTSLQEWLQARTMPLPNYVIESIQGDTHNQTFNVSCRVSELEYIAHGAGRSRRRAEQHAADAFLVWLQNEYS